MVRADLRRRWPALLLVVALAGVAAGASLAALAGARRTATAFDRHLVASDASDMEINPGGFDPESDARIRALRGVEDVSYWAALTLAVVDEKGEPVGDAKQPISIASDGRFYDMDRVNVSSGRLPRRTSSDEVAVNREVLRLLGVSLGSTLRVARFEYTLQDGFEVPALDRSAPIEDVRVVGVMELNEDVVIEPLDRVPRMLFSPARLPRGPGAADEIDYPWYGLQLAEGEGVVGEVERAWRRIVADHNRRAQEGQEWLGTVHSTADVEAKAKRGVRPLVIAMAVFGAIGLVATISVLALSLTRLADAGGPDLDAARVLGVDRRSAVLIGLAPAVAVLAGAVVVAGGVAVAASVLFPLGPFSVIEPSPGVDVDPLILLGGAGALAIISLLVAAGAVLRRTRSSPLAAPHSSARTARWAGVVGRAGLPPPAVLGARYALEPGRGRTSVPTRATLGSVIVAVVVLVATTVFGANLRALEDEPRRFGFAGNAVFVLESGYDARPRSDWERLLDGQREEVASYRLVAADRTLVEGIGAPALVLGAGQTGMTPTIVSGRAPAGSGEIVVGQEILERIDADVGDTVRVGRDARRARITGVAVFPVLGPVLAVHTGLGQGVWLAASDWPLLSDLGARGGAVYNFALLRLRPGVGPSDLVEALNNRPTSTEDTDISEVRGVLRPPEVDTAVSLDSGQLGLAAVVAVVAVLSLVLTLVAVVRRRGRDLAVHRALGFTPRQAGATTIWQALVTVAIALAVGLPLGLAAGRWLWIGFAGQINVVPDPVTPVRILLGLVAGMLVVALAAALVPARAAARTTPAVLLRAE